ncbi:MAG: glycosyltransferase [Bacteroidales bacterium]
MEKPVLSIIVPVYNVESYLHACIDSIRCQSFSSFELILVNDGSPDNCGSICERYKVRDQRITVVHQTNRGLSAARNTGIDIAQGTYITFIDSDDVIAPDTLALNMQILQENSAIEMLEYPIFVYYGAPEEKLWRKGPHEFCGNPFNEWFHDKGYRHTYACNKIFKRSLFDTIRFPEGKLFEDVFTIPQIIKICTYYYVSDKGIYYYYAREGSISRKQSFEQYRDLFISNYELLKMASEQNSLQTDVRIFSLEAVNWIISMTRADNKRTDEILPMYQIPGLSPLQLIKLPVPLKSKIKNLPLALFGIKVHRLIYAYIK